MNEHYITVAPKGYSGSANVDYACTGNNDEQVLQAAIDHCVRGVQFVFRMHGARLACSGKITNMDLQKVTKTVLYSMFLPMHLIPLRMKQTL